MIYTHPAPLVLIYDWQGGEFAKRLGEKISSDREELAAHIDEGRRVICYDAETGETDPTGEGFEWFCGMAFELSGKTAGRKLIVVDETQDLIDPWEMPTSLGNILSRGRRRMMDTCLVGRAANALNTVARDQVSELYCFRLTDDNSMKYPASLGLDTDEIRNLKDTHFIYRNNRTGETKKLALWQRTPTPISKAS